MISCVEVTADVVISVLLGASRNGTRRSFLLAVFLIGLALSASYPFCVFYARLAQVVRARH